MEILTFILSAMALLFIYLIEKSVLRKDTKDLKIGFGFVNYPLSKANGLKPQN